MQLKAQEKGFITGAGWVILVAGLALVALLYHGITTGQELPIGPAIAVILVNLFAAWKLYAETRARRRGPPANTPPAAPGKGKHD